MRPRKPRGGGLQTTVWMLPVALSLACAGGDEPAATSIGPQLGTATSSGPSDATTTSSGGGNDETTSGQATNTTDTGSATDTGPPTGTGDPPPMTSSTTDAGESSSSTGPPPVCPAQAGDNACFVCARLNCCPEVAACESSAICTCVYDCLLVGTEAATCGLGCGIDAAVTDLLGCGLAQCQVQCEDVF